MRKRYGLMALAPIATLLIGAPGVSAATEVGNNCTANAAVPDTTMTQLSKAPGGLPLTVPANGVVTAWKTIIIPFEGSIPTTLKVMRGGGPAFQVITESSPGTVVTGTNIFPARIPVQAGDRFGLSGGAPYGTPLCVTENPLDLMGLFAGNATVGSTPSFEPAPEFQVAVAATIEPDADNDGYGDETQDKCPQSAAIQTECPVVTLDATPLIKKGSVILLVTASSEAPVTVSASARLPNLAKSSAFTKLRGQTKTVNPGKVVRFRLGFSKALRSTLKALPASKSVKLKIVSSAKDVAGRVTKKRTNVKLKGQG